MEILQRGVQDNALQSPRPTSSNSTSSSSSSNGVAATGAPSLSPFIPKSTPRSIDANPCPTTFIQADTSSFKQVVQMLTGSIDTASKHTAATAAAPPAIKNPILPAAKATGPKKPSFKLHERRGDLRNLKMISPRIPAFMSSNQNSPASAAAAFSRQRQTVLSPSILTLPLLTLSPITPLTLDPFNRAPQSGPVVAASGAATSGEDQAIADKGFYLHPSPRTDGQRPILLPLFPLTSPRVSSASAADSSV